MCHDLDEYLQAVQGKSKAESIIVGNDVLLLDFRHDRPGGCFHDQFLETRAIFRILGQEPLVIPGGKRVFSILVHPGRVQGWRPQPQEQAHDPFFHRRHYNHVLCLHLFVIQRLFSFLQRGHSRNHGHWRFCRGPRHAHDRIHHPGEFIV